MITKNIVREILIILLCIPLCATAQKEDLEKYFNAYKTKEFDESKKIIADYSFGGEAQYTLADIGEINGVEFSTDIEGLKGYKAIITCKVENKLGGLIEKRMMAVAYFDKTKNHWSVFGFGQAADPANEFEIAKKNVDAGDFYTDKEYVFRNLAYWAMMAGKINEAEKYEQMAFDAAKEHKNDSFSDETKNVLASIK